MTRTPRASTKRLAPAHAPNMLRDSAKKPSKPSEKAHTMALKGTVEMTTKPKIPVSVPIQITLNSIEYVDGLAEGAGYLSISPGNPDIKSPNGDTLLHLLFFLIYTQRGAQILSANKPGGSVTSDMARANLRAALLIEFPKIDPVRLTSVIEAHIAADGYVSALESGDTAGQAVQQALYSQNLLAILGELHDDAMAHEFSMRW
jgi:hypothetical protein